MAGGNGAGRGANQVSSPSGLTLDSEGNIYVADFYNHRIQKWAPGASEGVTVAGGNGNDSGANQLSGPFGVALDSQGNVYIADRSNNRIQKWAPGSSTGITVAGGNGYGSEANEFRSPYGVVLDSQGNIYVADYHNHRIQKWAPGARAGVTVAGGNGSGSAANQLTGPYVVALDSQGNIYIADTGNNRIQKWLPGANEGVTVAGGNGQGSGANQLYYPSGVALDSQGNIYVADRDNDRILRWAPGASAGVTVAGGNGRGSGANQLYSPRGVALDSQGNIYVGDTGNNRIQKFGLLVVITSQPEANATVCAGGAVTASVEVSQPQAGFTYQWYKDNQTTPLAGQNSATLSLTNVQSADAGSYRVVITGVGGSVTSDPFQLTVTPLPNVSLLSNGPISCARPTVTLIAPAITGARYAFSNGVTPVNNRNIVTVTTAGTYSVTITTVSGCSASTSVEVTGNTTAPTASLTAGGVISCANPTVTLTAPAIEGATYAFSNGATQVNGGNTATVTTAGTYSVTVTTPNFCSASASVDVTGSSIAPTASLTASGVISCTNPTVTLTAPAIEGATYAFSNGATQINGGNTATVTTAGTYSVTITTPNGCSASASARVTGNATAPTASLTADGVISCAKLGVTLTAPFIVGATYTFSGGAIQVNGGNKALVPMPGIYSVTITTANGCSASASVEVTGNTTPPTASLTASGVLSCTNPTVTLTAPAIANATYTFSNGATQVNGGNTATVTTAGTYSVTITSANGCSASASVEVTGNTTAPTASLTNSGVISCANPTVTLTAPVIDGATYTFSNGAIQVNGGNTATVTAAGTYSVTITTPNGCSASASVEVTGNTTAPTASLTASGAISCTNPTITLTAPVIDGATYTFSNGATQINGGNTATVTVAGTYSVTIATANGCSASTSVEVTGSCVVPAATLSVLHQDADYNQLTNNTIRPYLQLLNEGTTAVPYGEITIRYWLTVENFSPITNLSVYWAQLGTNKVKMKYVELPQPRQGAFGYIEYSFDASAGSLAPGANSGPVQSGIGKQDWTNFNEADDYSYANNGNYARNNKITVYRNGTLVGGAEPSEIAPLQSLKAYSETKSSATTNSISTYVQLRNEGNIPVNYNDLKVRYYFTAEGNQSLNFYLDFAQLGNAKVKGTMGKLATPVAGADSYLELSFTGLDKLYPLTGTGNIQYRIAKSDWSNFNQTDDHSYNANGSMAENTKMVVYLAGTKVYGTEPSGANARIAVAEERRELEVTVLGNPVQGDQLDFTVSGATGQPLGLLLTDLQGRRVAEQQWIGQERTEHHRLSIAGQAPGVLLLRVSTANQVKTVKVIKTN